MAHHEDEAAHPVDHYVDDVELDQLAETIGDDHFEADLVEDDEASW